MVPLSKAVYTKTTNFISYTVMGLVALCFLVPVANNYSQITVKPPLENYPGATVTWIDDSTMMLQTRGGRTIANCPEVWIERGLETLGGKVPVSIELLSGPFKDIGPQTERSSLKDVRVGERPPAVGLVYKPPHLEKLEILGYYANQIVLQNQACDNGWWGTAKLVKIAPTG